MRSVDERWQRPGPTRRQQRRDVALGVAVAAFAVLNLFLARSAGLLAAEDLPGPGEQVVWVLALTLPLGVRRRWPDAVALIMAALFIGSQVRGVQEQQVTAWAMLAMIYTLGAWGRQHRRSQLIRFVIIGAMFSWLGIAWAISHHLIDDQPQGASGELPPLLATLIHTLAANVVVFGFAYLLGEAIWHSTRRQHQLEVQAAELLAAQELAGRRAVAEERLRIARDLHDVVAHHVSVMGIQASACRRVLDRDPDRARTALSAVEDGARTAVDELRRMLGALRSPDSPPDENIPAAGLDRMAGLADRVRGAGLEARYAVYGDPAPVPDSVSQAAYRIAQEAVTNTLKHASATTVDIRVRYLAGELEVDVADDGTGPAGQGTGTGMGLIGMRERVAVHDGTLESGRRTGGGFRVRARLPIARTELAGDAR
ncbi:sensor histidine kinase [Actinoplanes sp. NPDC051494]|uniref:sensor histidine kinase n=1 Tax=Actinoplanes sp. NPDC051494 TaxID=3363907 RepID=UPI0037A96AC8